MLRKFFFFFLLFPSFSYAQLPSCDVWIFSYNYTHQKYSITEGFNVSNHDGYDNEPSFSENGTYMLWASQRDSNETDIFRYDMSQHTTTRITQTAYSEYSPTFMYGNKYISSVVVEKDSVQRIWKYNKFNGEPKLLLPKVYGVGYTCWYDQQTLFFYQVTEPATLVVANVRSGVTKTCVSNVGRSMQVYHSMKRKMLLYTTVGDSGEVWIKALDNSGNKLPEFKPVRGVAGSQDFAVDRNGNILMASGSKLYQWSIGKSTSWEMVADLSAQGLRHITRITISPDGKHIALVNSN